ncbi:diguanylate cyclase, partial [Acinetobacter baumannii]|uniref:diguanylate cyclase domain-containing protein n=1 Tax=Acinetobacter baumannii TaxID=470 RepID=UPI00332AA554
AKPFTIGNTQASIPASIGTSCFPEDGQSVDELLQNAHAAMCHAKESGQNRLHPYHRQLAERPSRLLALEQQLREAVEHNQLVLHYQPQW